MKAGRLKRSKQRCQDVQYVCWKVDRTLWLNYVTDTFLLVSYSGKTQNLLCFVHGQGQKSEQNMEQRTLLDFITISLYQLWLYFSVTCHAMVTQCSKHLSLCSHKNKCVFFPSPVSKNNFSPRFSLVASLGNRYLLVPRHAGFLFLVPSQAVW